MDGNSSFDGEKSYCCNHEPKILHGSLSDSEVNSKRRFQNVQKDHTRLNIVPGLPGWPL